MTIRSARDSSAAAQMVSAAALSVQWTCTAMPASLRRPASLSRSSRNSSAMRAGRSLGAFASAIRIAGSMVQMPNSTISALSALASPTPSRSAASLSGRPSQAIMIRWNIRPKLISGRRNEAADPLHDQPGHLDGGQILQMVADDLDAQRQARPVKAERRDGRRQQHNPRDAGPEELFGCIDQLAIDRDLAIEPVSHMIVGPGGAGRSRGQQHIPLLEEGVP